MSSTPEEALLALQPWIEKHLRTAWKPILGGTNSAQSLSCFSGIPLLLPDEAWPTCKSCGDPMELMLQLELSKLPTDRHGQRLLQLFYCVTGDACDLGWEAFANYSSLCRAIAQEHASPTSVNHNRFPTKAIDSWHVFEDSPDSGEHNRLGVRIDYHFNDVPFQPMELWCDELDLHFVGSKFIDCLEQNVQAADGDKLGGWPRWVQGVEYPTCPQCGSEMALVMQIDSEDNVPYMFGDCGIGHITQCPTHHDVVAFAWACS